jgi:hypothetical protein
MGSGFGNIGGNFMYSSMGSGFGNLMSIEPMKFPKFEWWPSIFQNN